METSIEVAAGNWFRWMTKKNGLPVCLQKL